jgi:hypothetical protein
VASSCTCCVRAVFAAISCLRLSSTSLTCLSCALIRARVASRFRSERLADAPTRYPMNISKIVVTVLNGKLNPFDVNHAGRKLWCAKYGPSAIHVATTTSQKTMFCGVPIPKDTLSAIL